MLKPFAFALIVCVLILDLAHAADTPPDAPSTPPVESPAPLDVVTLKDGCVIYGEVIEMMAGVLVVKSAASPDNAI
ncbi:MAG TPA: hypothetical protein VH681_01725, partial [Nitrospiraceae bacterium]